MCIVHPAILRASVTPLYYQLTHFLFALQDSFLKGKGHLIYLSVKSLIEAELTVQAHSRQWRLVSAQAHVVSTANWRRKV